LKILTLFFLLEPLLAALVLNFLLSLLNLSTVNFVVKDVTYSGISVPFAARLV